jgi:hypothetical protein
MNFENWTGIIYNKLSHWMICFIALLFRKHMTRKSKTCHKESLEQLDFLTK